MIGTIVQFMKQDGIAQQTVSIDQPPRVVIDAIRHGTPQFVRNELTRGNVETIDILKRNYLMKNFRLGVARGLRPLWCAT